MKASSNRWVDFSDVSTGMKSAEVWVYSGGSNDRCVDVPQAVYDSLSQPEDFPPLDAAIVPGDRIAIALDPNVPAVADVMLGTLKALGGTDAAEIAIVVGDEISAAGLDSIRKVAGPEVSVNVHQCEHRENLRYVAADRDADPIYLNRTLVDADLVLPVVVTRPLDRARHHDLTGIYPTFADSASRIRNRPDGSQGSRPHDTEGGVSEAAWMLGIQIMVSITPGAHAGIARIEAGTAAAVGQRHRPMVDDRDGRRSAALVVAVLDGDHQQQTWDNAARAVDAATRLTDPGGTIVLWSEIDQPPEGTLRTLAATPSVSRQLANDTDNEFPPWRASHTASDIIRRVARDYRLLIHSGLDDEIVEAMGIGAISSSAELIRLSGAFETCAILRTAQFAGGS